MKRIFAMLISISMLAVQCGVNVYAQTEDYAEIIFGKYIKAHNISGYGTGAATDGEIVVRNGREGLKFTYEPRVTFMYLNVDDEVFYEPEGIDVRVKVDYFDEGKGTFTMRHSTPTEAFYDNNDIVRLNDTKEWLTHEFILKNADFRNKCNGNDIVLAQWSTNMPRTTDDVIFGSVRIERIYQPVTESFSSDEVGNIFSPKEEMKLRLDLQNVTDTTINAKLNYGIYDHEDKLLYTGENERQITGSGDVIEIKPEITKFGIYKLKGSVSYEYDGEQYNDAVETWFSLADKFEPGEEKNKKLGVTLQYTLYNKNPEYADKVYKVLDELGVGMVRGDMGWWDIETEKEVYNFASVKDDMQFKFKDMGIEPFMILDYGSELRGGKMWNDPPSEGEYLDAYVDFCVETVKHYRGVINYYEIWNEYNNIPNFNGTGKPPADYAKMIKAVVPAIKAVAPEVTLIGGVTEEIPLDWFDKLFDEGVLDYLDAISVHPYQWSTEWDFNFFRWEANELKTRMKNHSKELPVWSSELGWTSGTETNWYCSPIDRAIRAVKAYIVNDSEHIYDRYVHYCFQNVGINPYTSAHNAGLIRFTNGEVTDFAAEDGYVTYAAMNKLIGTALPNGSIVNDDGSCLYKYDRKDGKNVIAAWSEGETRAISVRLDTNEIAKLDIYGNKLETLYSEDGVFVLSAEEVPVYYTGDFESFEQAEGSITVTDGPYSAGLDEEFTIEVKGKADDKISLEIETELEVISNENGKAVIKAPKDRSGNERFFIRAYNGDKVCYASNSILRIDTFETSLRFETVSNSYSKAILTIKNLGKTNPISGTASLSETSADIKLNVPVRFVEIPPQKSMDFEIGLPEMIKKRPIQIKTEVKTTGGYEYSCEQKADFTIAKYADKKPEIDGIIDGNEWKGAWFAADKADMVKNIKDWRGEADLSFCGNLMWDEDNLYLAAVVKDDVFSQDYVRNAVWNGDSIQFGLNDNSADIQNTSQFTPFCLSLTKDGTQLYRSAAYYFSEAALVENVKMSAKRTSDGVVYEAAIPWSEIFYEGYTPDTSSQVGFSILFNDNDGNGRRGWIEYNSGIGSGKDYTQFGKITFIK